MATKFELIRTIHEAQKTALMEATQIIEGFTSIGVLVENVTHVLANIATKAGEGKQISLASQDSVASFLAGVEAIADRLPQSTDMSRVQNMVRALNKCGIESDGMINTSCVPVAEIGARFGDIRKKYYRMLATYNMSLERGRGIDDQLTRSVKALQHKIDTAMRTATVNVSKQQPKTLPPTAPSRGGVPVR